MIKPLITFSTAVPKYGGQVVSLNNAKKWLKFSETPIKNEYKISLKQFYIPERKIEPLSKAFIIFRIFRKDKRMLDSDSLGYIIKWTIDAIKEENWFIDDDQITYIVFPSVVDKSLIETELTVSVYEDFNPEIMLELET